MSKELFHSCKYQGTATENNYFFYADGTYRVIHWDSDSYSQWKVENDKFSFKHNVEQIWRQNPCHVDEIFPGLQAAWQKWNYNLDKILLGENDE